MLTVSMTFPSRFALALGAILASCCAAAAPGADPNLPPPGLYRVDQASNSAYRDGTSVAIQQSESGAGTLRAEKPGSTPTTRALPGEGARQICIGARGGAFNPLALNGKSDCKNASTTQSPAGTTFAAQCGPMNFKSVLRKLDASTWEISTHIDQQAGSQGASGLDQQRRIFEAAVKKASTPQARAAAQYTLDHWDDYKAGAAAASGAAAPPASLSKSTLVTRLSRIADSCTPAR